MSPLGQSPCFVCCLSAMTYLGLTTLATKVSHLAVVLFLSIIPNDCNRTPVPRESAYLDFHQWSNLNQNRLNDLVNTFAIVTPSLKLV